MSKITKYFCDVCKKEKDLWSIRTDFSVTHYKIAYYNGEKLFYNENMDICFDCLNKIIKLRKVNENYTIEE